MSDNCKEEQAMELEAMESMFEPDKEFFKASDTEFRLVLKPYPQGEEENHVGITLKVKYTDTYPETAPELEYEDFVGLQDDKQQELKAKADEAVESSLGMAMMYTVASTIQDYLRDHNIKALSMHEEMLMRHKEAEPGEEEEDDEEEEEEEDEPEWKGLADKSLCDVKDRVTAEQFEEWKVRFEAEMIANGTWIKSEQRGKTGKLIFLETREGVDGKESAPGATQDVYAGDIPYDAALFGEGDDDEDLDDLEDD